MRVTLLSPHHGQSQGMGGSIHLLAVVDSCPPRAALTLGDGHWREMFQPHMVPRPHRYLEAPAWAVLGQYADVRGVSAGTDEAGQMLVLDIPHLRWSRVWDQAHAMSLPTQVTLGWGPPIPPCGAELRSTYVL